MKKAIPFFILIPAIVLLLLVDSRPRKRTADVARVFDSAASNSAAPPKVEQPKRPALKASERWTLDQARNCAVYIDQVYSNVPAQRGAARDLLVGLQSLLFTGDYIMASKKDSNIPLTGQAISQTFSEVSKNQDTLKSLLQRYSSFPEDLPEHYQRARANPAAGTQISQIESAIADCGVQIDQSSDLLIDCFRLAGLATTVRDEFGPRTSLTDDSTPMPEELHACLDSFGQVFSYRFRERYGLPQAEASNLVARLSSLHLDAISEAMYQVPAVFQ